MKKLAVIGVLTIILAGMGVGFAKAENPFRVFLDEQTIKKGYTVKDRGDNFRLGIFPNVFKRPGAAKIEQVSQALPVPKNKNVISDVFLYNVTNAKQILDGSVAVGIKYGSDSPYYKSIYFLNELDNTLREVPSTIDTGNKYVRAYLPFPYAKVVAVEDTTKYYEPQLKSGAVVPGVAAQSAVVVDVQSGKVLYDKDKDRVMTLASLTKIMTAHVILQRGLDFNKEVIMTAGDSAEGCMLPLSPGEILTVKDLFYSTLVGSMNNAARALARATDLNWDQFIGEMNNEAAKLGLSATHFNDPSGLDSANKSTAYEYARLSIEALRDFRLLQATTSKSYSFWTRNSGHFISMENTNKSLNSSLRITGGKTGYLPEANGGVGYNLMLKAKNRNDKEILVVVMGEGVYGQSFIDAENLAQWSFDNYQW